VPIAPASSVPKRTGDVPANILKRLLKETRTGAIVCLGSGPHNLVSNEIAKLIFDDCGDRLPVRFRWPQKGRRDADFLNEPDWLGGIYPDQPAGIWYLDSHQAFFLPRETDTFIRDYLSEKKNPKRSLFYDCGLLVIDVRKRVPLVLAAGHGGNATRACVQALSRHDIIADGLKKSPLKGRFVGCLVVARKKPTNNASDDLMFAEKKGRSWYLYAIDNEPEGLQFPEIKPVRIPQRP